MIETKKHSTTHLHCDQSVVYEDLFCKKIRADGCLVASAELLVDLDPHYQHEIERMKRPNSPEIRRTY